MLSYHAHPYVQAMGAILTLFTNYYIPPEVKYIFNQTSINSNWNSKHKCVIAFRVVNYLYSAHYNSKTHKYTFKIVEKKTYYAYGVFL